MIQELLKCGANVSEGAFSGNTPLQVASGRSMQNVRLLLESASGIIRPTSGKNKEVRLLLNNDGVNLIIIRYDTDASVTGTYMYEVRMCVKENE